MPIFHSGLAEMEVLKREASPEALRLFFQQRIREWRQLMFSGAGFTVGVFDDLAAVISSSTAFDLLPTAIDIARYWVGTEIVVTALALVEDLARKSDTTQRPEGLSDLIRDVSRSGEPQSMAALEGIKSWYRL